MKSIKMMRIKYQETCNQQPASSIQ